MGARSHHLGAILLGVSQFFERYTYFGISIILPLYFRDVMNFNEDSATKAYHLFSMICFFTPILGGILADSYLGKYKTILYFSIIYTTGTILLTLTAVTPFKFPIGLSVSISLLLIAIGSGSIKPVISAYGGDQFLVPDEDKARESYFSVLFAFVCAGIMVTMIVTPILRNDVSCFGEPYCYPTGFAVPGICMLISIAIFLGGTKLYRNLPLEESIVLRAVKCISYALYRKITFSKGITVAHWLDYAQDTNDKQIIQDCKDVLKILKLYIPLPIYWALFDQQVSRWTFQASKMDGRLFGGWYVIKPDQFQVMNAVFTLLFIPFCHKILYPLLGKYGLFKKPLQRLTTACLLGTIPFVLCGLVELKIQDTETTDPNSVHMVWLLPQYVVISLSEVILTVTLTEFSYSQAPDSMKSFLQSAWLLTSGLGNLIVIIIADVKFFQSQANEFFLFAGLNLINSLIFIILAFYYVPIVRIKKEEVKMEGQDNITFQEI